MNTTELLAQLEKAETDQAKAALVAEFTLSKLPQPIADVARRCAFLPWFTTDIIKAQFDTGNDFEPIEAFEYILGLSFVEQLPIGYTFHSQTRQGLIELYAKHEPDEIVLAYQRALPIWEAGRENNAAATAAICGLAIIGDSDRFIEAVSQLMRHNFSSGEFDQLNQMVEAVSEVEAYSFVKPLPSSWQMRKAVIKILYFDVRQKDYDRAIAGYNLLKEIFVKLRFTDPSMSILYILCGLAYRNKGEYDQAIADFDQAIALDPDEADAYSYRGLAYQSKGEYDQAIADFDQAIVLKPDKADAYSYRGLAYQSKGEYDQAIADFDQAIVLKPDNAGAYSFRGLAYRNKGEYDQAIADFDQAIVLKPDNADAYSYRGLAYQSKGDYDQAIADFDQAIVLKPDKADAYSFRGLAYRSKGDYDQAIQTLKQLLDIAPDHAAANLSLAACYRQLGYERAFEEQATKVRRLMVGESEYNRACMEAVFGNVDQALELLEVALSQKQTGPDWVRQDPDLNNIRDIPRFQELIGKYTHKS